MTHHPVGARPERRSETGRQAGIGDDVQLAVRVMRDNRPAGSWNPVVSLTHQPGRNGPRIERFVALPNRFDNCVPMVESGTQPADATLGPAGKIDTFTPAGTARCDVELAGTNFHRWL